VSNIWQQPLAGGGPQQVTRFETDRIFFFDRSPDGRQLVLSDRRIGAGVGAHEQLQIDLNLYNYSSL